MLHENQMRIFVLRKSVSDLVLFLFFGCLTYLSAGKLQEEKQKAQMQNLLALG